jgi:hypothetical protein
VLEHGLEQVREQEQNEQGQNEQEQNEQGQGQGQGQVLVCEQYAVPPSCHSYTFSICIWRIPNRQTNRAPSTERAAKKLNPAQPPQQTRR